MLLREVCKEANVSRRAVQGYEKAGLVWASGRTERGYLIYDTAMLERIKEIKLFQQLGFTVKEIGEIIDAPNDVLKVALEVQISILKEKNAHVEDLIGKAYALIEKL